MADIDHNQEAIAAEDAAGVPVPKDDVFEFEAPQYFDFEASMEGSASAAETEAQDDAWFRSRRSSGNALKQVNSPLYRPSDEGLEKADDAEEAEPTAPEPEAADDSFVPAENAENVAPPTFGFMDGMESSIEPDSEASASASEQFQAHEPTLSQITKQLEFAGERVTRLSIDRMRRSLSGNKEAEEKPEDAKKSKRVIVGKAHRSSKFMLPTESSKRHVVAEPHTARASTSHSAKSWKASTRLDSSVSSLDSSINEPLTDRPQRKRARAELYAEPGQIPFSGSVRGSRKQAKSTEELLLESMQKERADAAKRRRLNNKRMAKVTAPARKATSHSTKPLTEPHEFNLRTVKRLGNKTPAPSSNRDVFADFAAGDSSVNSSVNSSTCSATPRTITKPKPFSFATDRRAATRTSKTAPGETPKADPFVSRTEIVNRFQFKTPKRFRTKSRFAEASPVESFEPKLTRPEAFVERAATRVRGSKFKTREEEEAEYMASLKPFKARKLKEEIIESAGDLGVPRVPKMKLTEAEPFNFASDRRATTRKATEGEKKEEKFVFKARGVPTAARRVPRRSGPARKKALTIPKTPNFKSKQLVKRAKRVDPTPAERAAAEAAKAKFRARPMPMHDAVTPLCKRLRSANKLTEPEPFKLSTGVRGTAKERAEAELKREQEELERKRKFKARPMPLAEPPTMMYETTVTNPEPFNMPGERKHEEAVASFKARLEEEMENEAALFRSFKAKAIPTAIDRPFVPERSSRPLTSVANITLNSDRRAEERAMYEADKSKRDAAAAQAMAEAEEERKAQEEEEIKMMRKSMEFKARPVGLAKPFEVKSSLKRLTEPKTPTFRTKVRARTASTVRV